MFHPIQNLKVVASTLNSDPCNYSFIFLKKKGKSEQRNRTEELAVFLFLTDLQKDRRCMLTSAP